MDQESRELSRTSHPHIDTASQNRSSIFVFTVILIIFVGARLWRLTSSCLWFDEIFSVHAARYDWSSLLRFVAADIIHPPLFYLLLKIWISSGGESLLWLRLFPALTSITVLIPFWLLCRELGLRATETNVALLLLAVNGYLIKYAQEVRMYSVLLLLSICSLWLFVRFIKETTNTRKSLIILSIVNLLLIYSHYYGWLVVAGELAIVLLWYRQKLVDYLIATGILLLAFSPWVYAVTSVSNRGDLTQNIGWIARPRLSDIAQFFILLNEPFYFRQSSIAPLYYRGSALVGFMLLTVPVLVLLWKTYRQRHAAGAVHWLFVFSIAVIGLAFVLSWVFPYSVWGTRHLIILAVPYSVLAAIALNRLQPYWLKTTVMLIFGCWLFLAGTIFMLRRPSTFIWCAWEQLAQQVTHQQSSTPVSIYAFEDLISYHLWFALQEQDRSRFKVAVIKRVPGVEEDPAYFLPRGFSDIATLDLSQFDEVEGWIAFRDFKWDENRAPLKTLSERGYRVGNVLEVNTGGQRAFLVRISRNRER